jgi:acetylserotonin N-methyltransferase
MINPSTVLDLIEAFRRSKTMFAAVKLGVFDLLESGPATAADVAGKLGTNLDATERLLESCTGLKLLTSSGADPLVRGGRPRPPIFSNTPETSAYLCTNSPYSLLGYINYSNDVLIRLWLNLEDAIHEGTNRWNQTFGSSGPLFDSFFPTEEKMRTFIMGMHGFGKLSSPGVAQAFDLSPYKHIVDLGGATGHLTIEICERYPDLQGTVFDFDKVLNVAREQIALSPAKDRISCVPGDFFTDPLPPADLYTLGRILHDWSEEKIDILLRRIHDALPEGGALLIAEKLLNDDKTGPVPAQMQSMNMLLCTEGKERSLPEYREILARAGFRNVEGKLTGRPLDAILARV